jgi:hypothetical protein
LPSSPPEDDELDELSSDCPHDGAGLGVAQLGAGAGSGAGVGSTAGAAGLAGAFFAGRFLALAFLALAFFAAFFGAAALAFLADFFADFLAFFADFLAVFFADFFADFFLAVTRLFLAFLAFLPPFFFLPLAIVILLLPPINVYRAFQVVCLKLKAERSVLSWPGTACRPIEKLNRVHHRN